MLARHRESVLVLARTTSLLLLLCLASCGRGRKAQHNVTVVEAEPAVSILVLDPAGRLLDSGHGLSLYLVEHGDRTKLATYHDRAVHRLERLTDDDAQLLVIAQGCPPLLTPVGPGRNVVRLEAGQRVRMTIGGQRPKVPEGGILGLRLTAPREAPADSSAAENIHYAATAIAASSFDADVPAHPQYVDIPPSGDFDLLVPRPGTYELEWEVRWAVGNNSTAMTIGDLRGPLVIEPDTTSLATTWATERIETHVAMIVEGR